MHALSVSLLRAKQLPVITNGLGASPHARSTCTIGVVTVRPLNRLPARLYFKLKPDPNNTFFFIFTCTTQYPWVLANLNLSQAMAPSKKKRTHTVFRDSSAHRSASTSKPRFVGEKVKLGELLLNTFSGEWGTGEGELLTPVLRTSNFNEDGSLNYSTPAMRCIPEGKVAKKRMVRGDIILEKSGGTPKRPVGIMAFYDSDALALCSNFNQVLRFDESRILPRFAFHQLRWLKERNAFDRYTRKTTGLQNLQMKKLIELKLRVPQIEAQTSIATTLDEIVCDQRTLQQEIACLDSLVKSRFVEMFGNICEGMSCFDMTPINDLCTRIVGGGTPSMKHPEYYEDGTIPWLKSGDVKARVVGSGVLDITEAGLANSSARMVPEGSIIVVTRSGILKHSLPVAKAACPIAINQDLKALIPGDRILPDYLQWSLIVASPLLLSKVRATTADNIETSFLKSFKVPVPPVSLQREFVAFVAQVDKSRFIAQQQIEKLQMLYDSLAQDYFGD